MRRRDSFPSDSEIMAGLASTDPSVVRRMSGFAFSRAAESIEVRMALAASYRRRGVGSQAARWGITTPGWSSGEEIDDLRRWLLGQASVDSLDHVLQWGGGPLPVELRDLSDVQMPAPVEVTGPADRVSDVLIVAATTTASVTALAVVAVLVLIACAPPDTTLWTRIGVGIVVAGFSASVILWRRLSRGPDAWAEAFAAAQLPPPDDAAYLDLARRLHEHGRHREAVILLRARLRAGGGIEARRLLVTWAREKSRHAEAGRWGAPVDGLTTAAERDAYARHVKAGPGPLPDRVFHLSREWPDAADTLSHDLADVCRRVGTRPSVEVVPHTTRSLPPVWWGVCGVVLACGTLLGVALAAVGAPAATAVVRSSIGASGACLAVALFADAVWRRPLAAGTRLAETLWSGFLGAGSVAFLLTSM